MKSSLVAKILPTKKNGKRIVGTGYPISSELVLTAYHVACFDDRDNSIPICIEWPDIKDAQGKVYKVEVTDQVLIKCTDDGDGIAILKCKVPDEVVDAPLILPSCTPDRDRNKNWDSRGYPRFGKDDVKNIRETEPAMGKFYDIDDTQPILKLSSTGDPKKKEDWGGMSGAPVFQGCNMYGVIIDTPSKVNERLRAVSIPWLLLNKSHEFEELGLIFVNQQYEQYLTILYKEISKFLVEIKGTPLHDALEKKYSYQGLEATPENLFHVINVELLEDKIRLLEDYRLCCEPILNQKNSAEQARKLFVLLLGLMAPKDLETETKVHHLEVRTRVAVDIYISARYQLPPDLEQTEDQSVSLKESVAGKHAIEVTGFRETGWEPNEAAKEIANAVNVAINKTHKKVYGDEPKQTLDEFDLEDLNNTLLTRRKGDSPELIRFEIEYPANEKDRKHPLQNDEVCTALHQQHHLPDLPVVRYGLGIADQEAKLRTQVNEFFRLIQKYR